MANYYNEKILSKFNVDLKDAIQLVKTGADISRSKMARKLCCATCASSETKPIISTKAEISLICIPHTIVYFWIWQL